MDCFSVNTRATQRNCHEFFNKLHLALFSVYSCPNVFPSPHKEIMFLHCSTRQHIKCRTQPQAETVCVCVDVLLRKRPRQTSTVLESLFKGLLRVVLLLEPWAKRTTGLQWEKSSVKLYPLQCISNTQPRVHFSISHNSE